MIICTLKTSQFTARKWCGVVAVSVGTIFVKQYFYYLFQFRYYTFLVRSDFGDVFPNLHIFYYLTIDSPFTIMQDKEVM